MYAREEKLDTLLQATYPMFALVDVVFEDC